MVEVTSFAEKVEVIREAVLEEIDENDPRVARAYARAYVAHDEAVLAGADSHEVAGAFMALSLELTRQADIPKEDALEHVRAAYDGREPDVMTDGAGYDPGVCNRCGEDLPESHIGHYCDPCGDVVRKEQFAERDRPDDQPTLEEAVDR